MSKIVYRRICASEYVDKTGLIHALNPLWHTARNMVLVSRPRRFGKSYAAAMLCAYYGQGGDCRSLFADKEIARRDPSLANMGKYHVLYIDMSRLKANALEEQAYLDREAGQRGQERQHM